MASRIDTEQLLKNTDIVGVIQRYVPLTKKGKEYIALCPFHKEKSPSFHVVHTKRFYFCHGCGESGDAISFLMNYNGMTFLEAVADLKGEKYTFDAARLTEAVRQEKRKTYPSILPIPDGVTIPEIDHYLDGKPDTVWTYRDTEGKLSFFVARWNKGKKKEIRPFSYTEKGWKFQKPDAPCPLYGLDRLAANPSAPVAIFEGEKAADFAQLLMPKVVCMSWPGGSNAHTLADWSVIRGRSVILFPDNDYPGFKVMDWIGTKLSEQDNGIEWVEPLPHQPKGWDVADKEWEPAEFKAFVLAKVPFADRVIVEDPKRKRQLKPESKPKVTFEPVRLKPNSSHPFEFLGYEKTANGDLSFYFFVHASGKTINRTVSQMSETNLYLLAPLNWWEDRFKVKSWVKPAVNWIITASHTVGIFDGEMVRGRGAWMDQDRVVIHGGDGLVVNGKTYNLEAIDSRYIYEREKSLNLRMPDPLSKSEANRYLQLCRRLSWDRPVNGYLLAGWVVVASVCGALNWRPHIWVTGAKGTGKSTIMRDFVRRMLGKTCLFYEGDSTEAGIRQTLNMDALPVVFDESEGDNRKSSANMESILRLVRSMSFDSGAQIVKGSGAGIAKTYSLKSCFAFSSIGVSAHQGADLSRISILGLVADRSETSAKKWKETQRIYNEFISDKYVDALLSRTIGMLPIILDNAKMFTTAVVEELKDQRLGDQLGILIAGAFSLTSDGLVTAEMATQWVHGHRWDQEKETEAMRDEVLLINYLMEILIRFTASYGTVERSVAELVAVAAGLNKADHIQKDKAVDILKRHGFRVEDGALFVCQNHKYIIEQLKEQPWSKNPHRILERLDGAERHHKAMRFGEIVRSATRIPLGSAGIGKDPDVIDPQEIELPF